jgi:hypothetical protein
MAIKYTYTHFPIYKGPSKVYPKWDFWFENKPSGNPALTLGSPLVAFVVMSAITSRTIATHCSSKTHPIIQTQGCRIFLGATYQSGDYIPKDSKEYQMITQVYQITIKYPTDTKKCTKIFDQKN